MTNWCISSLIAEITNEMPYELPGLPPRNESPGQFAWEVIESPAVRGRGRGRGDVPRITAPIGFSQSVARKAIFTHWILSFCSLIHVKTNSGSLSHQLQRFSRPVDGCWMDCIWGALVRTGKWPITPSGNPESSDGKGGQRTTICGNVE